jgi:tetratricopeptide (TPR) repeat protein
MADLNENKGKEQRVSKTQSKELKDEQSENLVARAQQFIYDNSKAVSYSLIGLIVLVTLGFFLKNYLEKSGEENRQKAMVALTRILPYYEAPDYKRALFGDSTKTVRGEKIIGLLEIIEKYEDTDQGKLAALYAGSSYLALNKAKEAVEFFEIATDSPSKVVLTGAYAGLGASYELLKDLDNAVEYFVKASELAVTDASKFRYSYYAAKTYEKKGDKESAEKIYREIIAKDKFSEFANYSRAGLVRLGMKID